jgi:hypothetical protein
LEKRRIATIDLYEPPLDMFGTDAVGFVKRLEAAGPNWQKQGGYSNKPKW